LIHSRSLYTFALLAVMFLFYMQWFNYRGNSWEELFSPHSMQLDDLAAFGSSMFSLFFGMQYLAVFLLTPIYTAGVIAEEKDRRTLDLLLTTRLTNREIVAGLLASRLATLGLIFLTILPVLSLMEFLGGVDPKLVLAGFLITGAAIITNGSMCMLVSLFSQNATRALIGSYVCTLLVSGFWVPIAVSFLNTPDPITTFEDAAVFAIVSGSLAFVFFAIAVIRLRRVNKGSEH